MPENLVALSCVLLSGFDYQSSQTLHVKSVTECFSLCGSRCYSALVRNRWVMEGDRRVNVDCRMNA